MTTRADIDTQRNTGSTYAAIAYTGIGVGGAALLAAAIVFIVDPSRSETHERQQYLTVAPSVGPHGGGRRGHGALLMRGTGENGASRSSAARWRSAARSRGCPAAHDDYPGTACKTNADCYQGESLQGQHDLRAQRRHVDRGRLRAPARCRRTAATATMTPS